MTKQLILTCPFCGSDGEVKRTIGWHGYQYRVECEYCRNRTRSCKSKKKAIETWNARLGSRLTKTCSHCGEELTVDEWHCHIPYYPNLTSYRVCCLKCGLATAYCRGTADAVEMWDRRVKA